MPARERDACVLHLRRRTEAVGRTGQVQDRAAGAGDVRPRDSGLCGRSVPGLRAGTTCWNGSCSAGPRRTYERRPTRKPDPDTGWRARRGVRARPVTLVADQARGATQGCGARGERSGPRSDGVSPPRRPRSRRRVTAVHRVVSRRAALRAWFAGLPHRTGQYFPRAPLDRGTHGQGVTDELVRRRTIRRAGVRDRPSQVGTTRTSPARAARLTRRTRADRVTPWSDDRPSQPSPRDTGAGGRASVGRATVGRASVPGAIPISAGLPSPMVVAPEFPSPTGVTRRSAAVDAYGPTYEPFAQGRDPYGSGPGELTEPAPPGQPGPGLPPAGPERGGTRVGAAGVAQRAGCRRRPRAAGWRFRAGRCRWVGCFDGLGPGRSWTGGSWVQASGAAPETLVRRARAGRARARGAWTWRGWPVRPG